MLIAFVGDIHGRVFHTLAVLSEWQLRTNRKLDLVIQVGDLGAYPNPSEQLRNEKYVRQDPAELDFSRYLTAEGRVEASIRYIREKHVNRIYFIRGNHEDFDWLRSKSEQAEQGIVGIDPFDLYYYATDGTTMNENNVTIAFLGGIQTAAQQPKSIDRAAYEKLIQIPPGEIQLLITHDAPYGIGTNFRGETQGSTLISELIETIRPQYVIAGHYHHRNGPKTFGATTYLGLNVLVDLRNDGELRTIQPGSIAVLDTETNHIQVVTDDWLSSFDKDFDFVAYTEQLIKRDN